MKINFEIEEKSKYAYNLLKYYWLNNNGNFVAKVADLRLENKMNMNEYNSFIATAKCHIDFGQCCACKLQNLHLVKNRSEARMVFQNQNYRHFCSECRTKAETYCLDLDVYETKIVWMKLSFKYKLWEKLENEELHFLKSVTILSKDWNRIYHEIILFDTDKYFKILFKLDEMNLIYYRKEADWKTKIIVLEALKKVILEKKI